MNLKRLFYILSSCLFYYLFSDIIQVGAGSYTNALPPGKTFPPSLVYKTDNLQGAMPTNKWYSSILAMPFSSAHYGLPLSFKHTQNGLQLGLPIYEEKQDNVWGYFVCDLEVKGDINATELISTDSRIDNYSDWIITVKWSHSSDPTKWFKATYGHGLVFVFFEYSLGVNPKITFPTDILAFDETGIISGTVNKDHIGIIVNNKYYGIFVPQGGSFSIFTNYIIINLPQDKRFFSLGVMKSQQDLSFYYQHAYAFVEDTKVSWCYDEKTNLVTTDFNFIINSKQNNQTQTIICLFPHQWKNLKGNYTFLQQSFRTIRGNTKLIVGDNFSLEHRFFGILPFLPDKGNYNKDHLYQLLQQDKLQDIYVPDSYNSAKQIARTVNLIPIAEQLNDVGSKEYLIQKTKEVLTNWLTYEPNEEYAFFYYDPNWGSLIPFNNSFGDDFGLTDHHFQFGYFIYSAAILSIYDKNFMNDYAPMIELLIKDIFCPYRNDNMFPFLRYKDVYMGHCWASGFAWNNDSGNNEESTSEAMNAWAGIIMWGLLTGNTTYRDLGIWGYVTEYSAIKEYWFDIDNTNYGEDYKHEIISLLFGGSGFYGTWFSSEPEYIYGIQWYPITACHFYLGYDLNYCQRVYNSLVYDVSSLGRDFIYWKDYIWRFQAFFNPQEALSSYDENYQFDNGHTKTFLYHWLHNFNVLGNISTEFYSDTVSYVVFKKNDNYTFISFNFTSQPKTVNFYKVNNNEYVGSINVLPYSINASTYLITLDLQPTVMIKNLLDKTTISAKVDLIIEAKDDKMVKEVKLYLDNDEIYNWESIFLSSISLVYNLDTLEFSDGLHKIKVVAEDNLLQQGVYEVEFYIFNSSFVDLLPYVKILQPQEGATINGDFYIVIVATDDFSISKVEFYIDNLLIFIDTEFPYMFLLNTTNYLDGGHIIKVLAYDNGGNFSEDSLIVNINNTLEDLPPIISFVLPLNNSVVFGNVDIKVDVLDDNGIDKVEIYINDNLKFSITQPPYQWVWQTTEYPDGVYTIKAEAYDTIGQINISTINVIVSNFSAYEDINYSYDVKNYPNPFRSNQVTQIKFKTKETPKYLDIKIYDLSGKIVRVLDVIDSFDNNYLSIWDGKDEKGDFVVSGVYICKVKIDNETKFRKIVFIK